MFQASRSKIRLNYLSSLTRRRTRDSIARSLVDLNTFYCALGFLYASIQNPLACKTCLNGDGEIRTLDPLLARQVLSQLSYAPMLVKV